MAVFKDYNSVQSAILYALDRIGKSGFTIKTEQKEAICNVVAGQDVLAVLPTGFGKSLIFQLLPFVFDYLSGNSSQSSVIVISPLNGLIRDQIEKLKEFMRVGVMQINDMDTDSDGDRNIQMPFHDVFKCQIIFAHPEVFIDDKKMWKKIAENKAVQERVRVIVIDEAHLISEWKDFHPAYGTLSLMSTIFPSSNVLALTATATIIRKKEICQSLGLTNAEVIEVNPDRKNIFFSVFPRPNHGDNKLYDILYPLALELLDKNVMAPKTLIYR